MIRLGVDVGGTFTDLVVYDEMTKAVTRTKHPTVPAEPERGVVGACGLARVDFREVSLFMHATTLVTNLVIARSGARVGLITTRGFRDVLEIGRSYREELYNLQWEKPRHVVPRYLVREVTERVNHRGAVATPLARGEVEAAVRALVTEGVEAIAVCLFNAYANAEHERLVGEVVKEVAPQIPVCVSSEVDPRIREYERVSTTVLNAYAMPRVVGYVERLDRAVARTVYYMHSGGGIMRGGDAMKFPVTLLASGPAAGVLAARFVGRLIGAPDIITADVGGTSFDVAVIRDGEPDRRDRVDVVWGIPARIESVDVRSIGAGGGSIAWVDEGGVLRVGPQSAGAVPGPACYGAGGGEPTVTDANVVLGIVDPARFLGGRLEIDPAKARRSLQPIASHFKISVEEAARGIYRIVNANMAQAIMESTVKKGIDPRDFALLAFGGGGGQHAVEIARETGIARVVIPRNPSTLSAFGLLTADLQRTATRTVMLPLVDAMVGRLRKEFTDLERTAREFLSDEDRIVTGVDVEYLLDVRYVGQSNEVAVRIESRRRLTAAHVYERFEALHQRLYGTRMGDPAEVVNVRATVTGRVPPLVLPPQRVARATRRVESRARRATALSRAPLPVFDREALPRGAVIDGPCIVEEVDSTHFITGRCVTAVDRYGNLIVRLLDQRRPRKSH